MNHLGAIREIFLVAIPYYDETIRPPKNMTMLGKINRKQCFKNQTGLDWLVR